MNERKIAFWLIPEAPKKRLIEKIIADLARDFGSVAFEPHVTVCSGRYTEQGLALALEEIRQRATKLTLRPIRLACSPQFKKALFMELEESPALRVLYAILKRRAARPCHYRLHPHLSLLYAHKPQEELRNIAGRISLPPQPIQFDEIAAVETPATCSRPQDVKAWMIIRRRPLA